MQRLSYQINIQAPVTKVFDRMLGRETYRQWTSEFNPSSDFEGSWEKGSKIYFTGISKEGKKEGMVAEVMENIPDEQVSLRHYGVLDGDNEITEGAVAEGWTDAWENYSFAEENGTTTVTVDIDTHTEYVDYFNDAWPKALARLKQICEA